ncbi:MAG TPA: ABC transporter permease [Chitinophagaceae bacterium]|nr:ABC transporter permease [Chitinophagaceae bacterium]
MFKNYLKIALRNIRKNKLYSFVNIAGLAIGITGCLLIGLYVWNELSYDRFHKNADRIVRVTMEYQFSGTVSKTAVTGTKAGPQFKRSFPEVESYVRLYKYPMSLANGSRAFEEKNAVFADADFFKMFSFRLLRGEPSAVLSRPQTIVLTEKAAKRYFGEEDPVGKTLRINGTDKDYEVTGIAENAPLNSQIQYDVLISFLSTNASKSETWKNANYITYLLLNNAERAKQIEAKVLAYSNDAVRKELGIQEGSSDYWIYRTELLKDVHLRSELSGLEPNGNMTYIYVLSIVAILILIIACVNYTNLATAQSVSRSTEIGVRKVMGAGKKQLLKQFLGESFVLTFIALALAVASGILLLPVFNQLTGKTFTASFFVQPLFLTAALLLCIIISLLAGAYPAFVLSNTRLTSILKSGLRIAHSGGGLRKTLITAQFVIAIFLIAATIIVLNQVSFIRHKSIGYDREQVVVMPVDYKMKASYDLLKNAMRQVPGVVSVTGAYEDPTFIEWGDGITAEDGNGKKELSITGAPVDIGYLHTMGMQLAAGRDFQVSDFAAQDTSNNFKNYRSTYIINEKAAKDLGWTAEQAIGKTIVKSAPGPVVGVVKDFHFESLHTPIGPLVLFLDSSSVQQMFVKIRAGNTETTLAGIAALWKTRVPHRPFDYHFLDDDFNTLYRTEEQTASLFSVFAGVAIVLACLGLFALAAFTTVQRTKEIGIRKILGANTAGITLLISRQFMWLVGTAILIATPLGWWAGNNWLQKFAYRITLDWWIFAIAGIVAVLIALAAVSYHAIRVSLANPVKALRTE